MISRLLAALRKLLGRDRKPIAETGQSDSETPQTDNGAHSDNRTEWLRGAGGEASVRFADALARKFPVVHRYLRATFDWQREKFPGLLRVEVLLLKFVAQIAFAIREIIRNPSALWSGPHYSAENRLLRYRLGATQGRAEDLVKKIETFSVNRPVVTYVNFARNAMGRLDELEAEVYVGHGVQSLPAAAALAQASDGRYMCDCIEIPSFFDRAVPVKWHISNTQFLDHAFDSYLRRADGSLTVGWALGEILQKSNDNIHVIPNYRYREQLQPNARLREQCGLGDDDELVLSLSTVATGFEIVLEALTLLPETVHLASVGKFVPASYMSECLELAEKLGVSKRFHHFEPVEYAELTAYASSADVGLIVRDAEILNNAISLPNRIFDYMFSSVPVCTPRIPDIQKIVESENMGAVVRAMDPQSWAEAIEAVLKNKQQMRSNALTASQKYVWEELEDQLFDALGRPGSVTFLGANRLHENNRTNRMGRSLVARGVKVNIAYLDAKRSPDELEIREQDGIRYVPLANF